MALNVSHGKRVFNASPCDSVSPGLHDFVHRNLAAVAEGAASKYSTDLHRDLHVPNVSFKVGIILRPPLVPFGSGWLNAHYWKWDIKVISYEPIAGFTKV